eukprot:scaffold14698_cov135-Isochrysis_galbana.AAC.5
MRIDVTGSQGTKVAAVQAHRSFRRIVGQCAAEFALALMRHPTSHGLEAAAAAEPAGALAAQLQPVPAGVWTPEELARDGRERKALLERMLRVEGTLNFGVRVLQRAPGGETAEPLGRCTCNQPKGPARTRSQAASFVVVHRSPFSLACASIVTLSLVAPSSLPTATLPLR